MQPRLLSRGRRGAVLAALATLLSTALFAAGPAVPRPLADVSISTTNGKPIDLKQYRGKVLLVTIISQGCEPCVASIDTLNRVQRDLGPQGFQIISAVGDPNAQYMLQLFLVRARPIFPVGYLVPADILKLGGYDARQPHVNVPVFIFIDRKGTVQYQVSGEAPFFKDEDRQVRDTVQALLKK